MAQVALAQLVQGMRFIAQPVHPTLFPYPIATTVHAARISLAYQAKARAATASTGAKIPWGTYIVGYLLMTWGGTLWTHHLLHIPVPMLYSPAPYIIYTTTHLILTLLTALFPLTLSRPSLALLDTVLFPLDALVRTRAISSATALLSPSCACACACAATPTPTALTHLLIGALASSGGTLTASALATWAFATPAPAAAAVAVDVAGGALVAAVCGTLGARGAAFEGVRAALGVRVWEDDEGERAAAAVGAGVLMLCFGVRVWCVHWVGWGEGKGEREREGKGRIG